MSVKCVEYVVIGAGPAAICAIPHLLKNKVAKDDIIWIDPQFSVGDFGSTLSVGSSVPGNTTVESYQRVNKAIYQMMIEHSLDGHRQFELDHLQSNFVCTLKIAAEPLQHITNELRKLVPSIVGTVSNIVSMAEGLELEVKLTNGTTQKIITKRAILATGAKPKKMLLPKAHDHITMLDPNIAFIETELAAYLKNNSTIKTVAVIGSSHSAALAVMHLLKAGLIVKQFMNKEYKYAVPSVAPDGTKYTMFDNTGLKGEVAKFTKQLLNDLASGSSEFKHKLTRYIGKDQQETNALLERHLADCSHAVAAIGYELANTLLVNGQPLSSLSHNNKTTEFHAIPGLFGIGIAFPQQVQAISGEIEYAVGVGKFWTTISHPQIMQIWRQR